MHGENLKLNSLILFPQYFSLTYSVIYIHIKHTISSICWDIQVVPGGMCNASGVFLMLNYTDITQNNYIHSQTVTEILEREFWKFDSCYTLTDYQIHIKSAATPLIVTLSPDHSDITSFLPWSTIAKRNHLYHAKNSKLCSDAWHRWRFWFAVRHFATQFAEIIRVSKSS